MASIVQLPVSLIERREKRAAKRKPLGEILIEDKLVRQEQMKKALEVQKARGQKTWGCFA